MKKTIFLNKFFIYFFTAFYSFSFSNTTFTMHDHLDNFTKDGFKLLDAIKKGDLKSVIELRRKDANINVLDKDGFSPIFLAYSKARFDIVKELLKMTYGNIAYRNINMIDIVIQITPLIKAILDEALDAVKKLIENGADANLSAKNGFPPIFYAYSKANFNIVAELKNAGAQGDINMKYGPNKITPLIMAIKSNNLEVVKKLIANDANINLADVDGYTPIFHAYREAKFDIVTELEKAGAQGNINIQVGQDLITPLIDAIKSKNLEVVKKLIANGANTNLSDINGYTPIFFAYSKAYFDIVAELEKSGAQGNINIKVGPYLSTPLVNAILHNDLESVKKLIEKGADINLSDKNGYAPIFYAYSKAYFDIVTELKNVGAQGDINIKAGPNLSTPLIDAFKNNNLEAVKKLIANGANTNLSDRNGYTPIFHAYSQANFDMATELKNAGAQGDINMQVELKLTTPLIQAIKNNNLEVVKKLIANGANTNLSDRNGYPPILYAYKDAKFGIVAELEKAGAKGNINMKSGPNLITPLICAILLNNLTSVEKLILAGADINITNKQNQTPLHIACQENNIQIVRLLLEQNANIDDNLYQTVPNIEILKYLNLRKDFTLAGDKIEFILLKKENPEDLKFLVRYTLLNELKKLNLETPNNKDASFFDNLFAKIYALGLHEIAFKEEIAKQKAESKIELETRLYELANIIAKENNIKLKNALSLESEENKMKENITNKERNNRLCDLIVQTI